MMNLTEARSRFFTNGRYRLERSAGKAADEEDERAAAEAATKIQATFRAYKEPAGERSVYGFVSGEVVQLRAAAFAFPSGWSPQVDSGIDGLLFAVSKRLRVAISHYNSNAGTHPVSFFGLSLWEPFRFPNQLADIDLSDPSLNQAASKIQATFRGHRVRKSPVHQPTDETGQQQEDKGEELPDELKDMDLNDPDLAKAAVKIQATFRGYKTRNKE
ncbi:hypothetical protein HPB48_016002 [Haemaphysalis longicornis]|uniref:Uncharacterized protein n=1 Tax=Haemaphysalis longicornis TaxID=44386 RepID=A0A9J6FRY5_HAELO|nr:hypothetical protein HPB48_016002 [Haemaphysalis longicornis]